MTPIEAAVKAGTVCGLVVQNEKGDDHPFDADDARAIITAFLEAAAGDHFVRMDVGCAAVESHERTEHPVCVGRAAILALKEAVNG